MTIYLDNIPTQVETPINKTTNAVNTQIHFPKIAAAAVQTHTWTAIKIASKDEPSPFTIFDNKV